MSDLYKLAHQTGVYNPSVFRTGGLHYLSRLRLL